MSEDFDKPNLLQVIVSTLAGAFGVQSEKNRLRDFQHGSAKAYIVTGIIGTVVFVLTVYGVVRLVLSGVGK
ncbi:DUF2970 domain-containing protein [Methylococcus capsulatus]|uniref:DUF2970 domain-containing protein n=1 Tax=Methylococcus capsulatus TaxID=414 RepID=A0AA35UK77_METCP|nr:DUF2970 domain-containing protein [Methylococcus capsulatus]QXP87767.1 DUF2970 domain-containing protein [Methylococcus capsulatus]QXP92495.1 DUF2970 domain-containing protein [Methylococcus capsulatus]UQN12781.1 DUF2970 domain-containing protein [Methylococcus capsulatus]CAI8880839.1 DUF2970 domain-containing protein [Methylococcus capsulatus]